MASISSVITGGFGVPGSASLVITDGFGTAGTAPVATLRGRIRRRRLWLYDDKKPRIDPQALREEPKYIASLATVSDLLAEQQLLRESLELATARQHKTISTMIEKIERRMAEIEDEEAAIVLLT